jgi:hypothetical protein
MEASPRPPTRSILTLDDGTIERVAQTLVPLSEDRVVNLGMGLTARLAGGAYVEPWHQFALSIISSSLGDRPVYFASSGNAASALGLNPYLVRQGLAFRLNEGPVDPEGSDTVVELPYSAYTGVTGLFIDADRTRTLAEDVFIHRTGLPDEWPRWPWRAVLGIPSYYSWVHYALYEWALSSGDQEEADYQLGRAEAWAALRSRG